MEISFTVNDRPVSVDVERNTPLLWVVRDDVGLKGTKYGCGRAMCGACSLHVDGELKRSCSYPAHLAEGTDVTTVEGLSPSPDDELHPIHQAWMEEVVPQCGYCQPGFMMAAAALLARNPSPSDDDIDASIVNICRCGTHIRIRRAIHRAAELHRTALPVLDDAAPTTDATPATEATDAETTDE